jgi:hypothetical protein
MPDTRFGPDWHLGDADVFSRVVGNVQASPIDHNDPVHQERIRRYERNILYYQEAQYGIMNRVAFESNDFLNMRVNYTSIARRSVNMKADWLFSKPVGINVKDTNQEADPNAAPTRVPEGPSDIARAVIQRTREIREYNQSDFWDWVMSVMGLVCGDFFCLVEAVTDSSNPTISLLDPSYSFPDYPRDINRPMRAFQLQYSINPQGDPVVADSMTTQRIVEDYRLEVLEDGQEPWMGGFAEEEPIDTPAEEPDRPVFPDPEDVDADQVEEGFVEEFELPVVDDERLTEYYTAQREGRDAPFRLTCVYRKFIDGDLDETSVRDIGIPAIPVVHGRNANIWNTRYGTDEIYQLIPLIEKYNEMFYYAERVARHNAHAKLFISGVKSDTQPLQSDFDDVLYGGTDTKAEVISLPSDVSMLEFVTSALETEMHRNADIPVIAQGETEIGYGAVSGLALQIRFGPLQAVTSRHQTTYGNALSDLYKICLMFDEMVIAGRAYGEKWKYSEWKYDFDWHNAMPQALSEIISDMVTATGGKAIISVRTAQEQIPGIDPAVEEVRMQHDLAMASQQSLTPPDGTGALPDGVPTQPPYTFPSSWTVRKEVFRDSSGRLDYVLETITPEGTPAGASNGNGNGSVPNLPEGG